MRSSSDIYGQYLKEFMISQEQVEQLQQIGLSMLKDFHKICVEHNIKYSLVFGTMLGAIRHKGFIPWDDDIDVIIFRKDYEKLKVAVAEMSDKYYILDNKLDKQYNLPFSKFIKKNTLLVEAATEKKINRGCFIDIFLVDNAPKNMITLRKKLYVMFNRLASLECDFKFPSETINQIAKNNAEVKKYIRTRRFLGFFASVFPVRFWHKCSKLMLKGKKNKDKYVISGDVFRLIDKQYFDDLSLYQFEDGEFYGTTDYDSFLESIYKNYMQLPPENKRERHIIIKLELD